MSFGLTTNQNNFCSEVFSYSTQQQQTISQLDCDIQQKAILYNNWQWPTQWYDWEDTPKHFPKPNLHQKRGRGLCFMICCHSDPLQLSESQQNHCIWEPCSANRCCCYCVASVVFASLRPNRHQATRLHRAWDSPGKNTGVGCHFLLQRTKVKNESEVTESCPTLSDPMDCSLPGSSVRGIFQVSTGVGCHCLLRVNLWIINNSNKRNTKVAFCN